MAKTLGMAHKNRAASRAHYAKRCPLPQLPELLNSRYQKSHTQREGERRSENRELQKVEHGTQAENWKPTGNRHSHKLNSKKTFNFKCRERRTQSHALHRVHIDCWNREWRWQLMYSIIPNQAGPTEVCPAKDEPNIIYADSLQVKHPLDLLIGNCFNLTWFTIENSTDWPKFMLSYRVYELNMNYQLWTMTPRFPWVEFASAIGIAIGWDI